MSDHQEARLRREDRAETRRNLVMDGVEMADFMKKMQASRSMALVRSAPPFPPAPALQITHYAGKKLALLNTRCDIFKSPDASEVPKRLKPQSHQRNHPPHIRPHKIQDPFCILLRLYILNRFNQYIDLPWSVLSSF